MKKYFIFLILSMMGCGKSTPKSLQECLLNATNHERPQDASQSCYEAFDNSDNEKKVVGVKHEDEKAVNLPKDSSVVVAAKEFDIENVNTMIVLTRKGECVSPHRGYWSCDDPSRDSNCVYSANTIFEEIADTRITHILDEEVYVFSKSKVAHESLTLTHVKSGNINFWYNLKTDCLLDKDTEFDYIRQAK